MTSVGNGGLLCLSKLHLYTMGEIDKHDVQPI